MKDGTTVRENYLIYSNAFDERMDCKVDKEAAADGTHSYYVNTEEFLGEPINTLRIELYENALMGITNVEPDKRNDFIDAGRSLCKVTVDDDTKSYSGNCFDFFHDTYCPHVAILQFGEKLKGISPEIPTGRVNVGTSLKSKHLFFNHPSSKPYKRRLKTINTDLATISKQLLLEQVKACIEMKTLVIECQQLITTILSDDFVKSRVVVQKIRTLFQKLVVIRLN